MFSGAATHDPPSPSPQEGGEPTEFAALYRIEFWKMDLYRVPEIVTRGRFPDGGESDSTWRTQEARHVGSDTVAPGF